MRYPAICIALLVLLCLPLMAMKIDYPIRSSSDIASIHAVDSRRDYSPLLYELHSRADELQRELGIYTTRSVQIYIIDDPDLYKALSLGKNSIVNLAMPSLALPKSVSTSAAASRSPKLSPGDLPEYMHWLLDQFLNLLRSGFTKGWRPTTPGNWATTATSASSAPAFGAKAAISFCSALATLKTSRIGTTTIYPPTLL